MCYSCQIELKSLQEKRESPLLSPARIAKLVQAWRNAKNRLLITDYGGTLKTQTRRPQACNGPGAPQSVRVSFCFVGRMRPQTPS